MTGLSPSTYFCSNQMGKIILLAMDEILGKGGTNLILRLASLTEYLEAYPPANGDLSIPFEHIGRLQGALERAYGPRAGQGVALRIGQTCFKYGLREFGPQLGLTDLAFRLLPLPTKVKISLEAFTDLFNHAAHQQVRLEEDEHHLFWIVERCPWCWGRQEKHTRARAEVGSCCLFWVGLLQEALYWVSGGKFYQVEEKECIASGEGACTIVVVKTPLN